MSAAVPLRQDLNAPAASAVERAVASARFGMLILSAERHILVANERASALVLRGDVECPVGKTAAQVVQPELRSAVEGIISAVLRERRVVEADRVQGAAGRVVDVVGHPADDEAGRRVVLVVNDVTERLALEGQLVQSSKLATIGELAAGVAHEINNPTAFVHSNLRTLQRYWTRLHPYLQEMERFVDELVKDDAQLLARARADLLVAQRQSLRIHEILEDLPEALSESLDGTARIQKIVSDLKSFARPDDEAFRVVDLVEVVERAMRLVGNELKYVADVTRALAPLPPVRGNPSQLSQVIVNILMNAAQAIEGRGRIAVRTCERGDEVCVEVEDNGVGIAPHVLPRIFDPFFTTKPQGRGTGLGLSVSYGIVERHAGRIEVVTTEGQGALFRVVLRPAADLPLHGDAANSDASEDGGPRAEEQPSFPEGAETLPARSLPAEREGAS